MTDRPTLYAFWRGVATGIVAVAFTVFVAWLSVGFTVGYPQVIDCRYTGGPPAVQMEIGTNREHGEFVTFRALGCTGYWHVNSRT